MEVVFLIFRAFSRSCRKRSTVVSTGSAGRAIAYISLDFELSVPRPKNQDVRIVLVEFLDKENVAWELESEHVIDKLN